jgi:hypothetical protein
LPLKLSSESHLFSVSTIAPDDFSGPRHSVALGGVIPDADGHVYVEGAFRRGTGCFQRIAHHRTQVIGELDDGHESLLALESFRLTTSWRITLIMPRFGGQDWGVWGVKNNLCLPPEGSLRQIKTRRPANGVYYYRIDGERVGQPGEVNRNRGRRNRDGQT